MEFLNINIKHVDNENLLFPLYMNKWWIQKYLYSIGKVKKKKKNSRVAILLLLHPMSLVKFLLETLSTPFVILVILLQIICIFTLGFLATLNFLGKFLFCLVDHL